MRKLLAVSAVFFVGVVSIGHAAEVLKRSEPIHNLNGSTFCFEKQKSYSQIVGAFQQDHAVPSKSKNFRCSVRLASRDTVFACPSEAKEETFKFGSDPFREFIKYKATTQSWINGKAPGRKGFPLKQLQIAVNDPTLPAFICYSKNPKVDVNDMKIGDLADALEGTVRINGIEPAPPKPEKKPKSAKKRAGETPIEMAPKSSKQLSPAN